MNPTSGTESPLVQEYSKLAADYDAKWSFYVEATVQGTLARMTVTDGERILDVGCGTGVLLSRLAQRNSTLVLCGIDPVPEMLEVARKRLPASVTLEQGWAQTLPFADGSFDKVVSCNMFHYIKQPLQALQEMRRVLAPGGQLVLTDWCDDYLSCKLCDWYLRMFNSAHYKTHGSARMQQMLQEAGFVSIKLERYKINWLWGLMTATAVSKP